METCQHKVMCAVCGKQLCYPSGSIKEEGACKCNAYHIVKGYTVCTMCFFNTIRDFDNAPKSYENDHVCACKE